MARGSDAKDIAETVYAAATDESDQLRFVAGPDAIEMLDDRDTLDDESHFAATRSVFGLS